MKIYNLDKALLDDRPQILVGDKVYTVDDRKKTVSKIKKLSKGAKDEEFERTIDETFALAFGKEKAKEIDEMNLPFRAYQRLFELVMSAVMGEEPDSAGGRFQEEAK